MKHYLYCICIALDVFICALLGGRSYQTISAYAWERSVWFESRFWSFVMHRIDWLYGGKPHCRDSYYRWWHGARYSQNRHGE